jgi:hypothetical protein
MKRKILKGYPIGIIVGFLAGFILLHPFSMLFQGMIHPTIHLEFTKVLDAFNPHHLTMAVFFGFLGITVSAILVFFLNALGREKEKVKILEGLLPICSYCKQIRDDSGTEHGKGKWRRIEEYISQKTDADFTHGVCPECYEKMMEEINKTASREHTR